MDHRLPIALVCMVCAPCWAQSAPANATRPSPTATSPSSPAAPAGPAAAPTERGEPNVKRIVVEDAGARIDELRVRGQTQQVVVTPKGAIDRPYEIIVGRGGREAGEGTGGANSAVGKRVWNVLKF